MSSFEEECRQRFHSLNGTAISIEGTTKWMTSKKNQAETIMRIWKDVFLESTYNTKLYLFYVANMILVQERTSALFVYTPLLNETLPLMVRVSFENILNEDSAKRILNTIRLWKERHTIGRTMTNSILESIPSHVFHTYPEYGDLNIHSAEMEDIDYYADHNPIYPDQKLTSTNTQARQSEPEFEPEPEHIPPERLNSMRDLCSIDLQEIADLWRNDFFLSEEYQEQRKEMQLQKGELEKMLKDYSHMQGNNYEDVEISVSKRHIQSLCFGILETCKKEIRLLQGLDEMIDRFFETNEYQQEDDQRLYENAMEYEKIINTNKNILEEENRKRPMPLMDENVYKRDTSYY